MTPVVYSSGLDVVEWRKWSSVFVVDARRDGERVFGGDRHQRTEDDRHRLPSNASGRQLRSRHRGARLYLLPGGLRRSHRPRIHVGCRVRRDEMPTAKRDVLTARGALHVLRWTARQVQGQGCRRRVRPVTVPLCPADRRLRPAEHGSWTHHQWRWCRRHLTSAVAPTRSRDAPGQSTGNRTLQPG